MLYSLIFLISILAACSYNPNEETSKINVNCQIKDTVSLNEPINLNASLTYDDQPREEAEIIFEVWESGNKNNSKMLQAENLGDGNYTHDYRSEEHTSELQSRGHLVCRLLLEKKNTEYKHG